MSENQILYIVLSIIIPVGLYWVKSVEKRMSDLKDQSAKTPTRNDVYDIIDVKQEGVKTRLNEVKEDCKEIKEKIDHLYDKLIG